MTPLAGALLEWVTAETEQNDGPPVLMMSGPQGAGKSTAIRQVDSSTHLRLACLSLDDFYHTAAERRALSNSTHPLCATRGPPGTHDLQLLGDVLDSLQNGSAGTHIFSPVFDKRIDDRVAREEWRQLAVRPNAILIEGWLMGVHADALASKSRPINELERDEDPNGIWRAWQEDALSREYSSLWPRADAFLHVVPADFDFVKGWRLQQEASLHGVSTTDLPSETVEWVSRFIEHFERLTKRLANGDGYAGLRYSLDQQRRLSRS